MSVLSLPVVFSQSASWCRSVSTLRMALFLKTRPDVSFVEGVFCKQMAFECFGRFRGEFREFTQYLIEHSSLLTHRI